MISLRNVSKSYGKNTSYVVKQLQLDVKQGEIFGFLGPNGAGKTTTIKMITGISSPDQGDVELDGVSMVTKPLQAKKKLGYVPDNPDAMLRLTGMEYLEFMADVYEVPLAVRKEYMPQLIEKYGMTEAMDELMQDYSRGMKQKTAIIGSLLHNPPIWILDEPMVGLDPRASALLKDEMRQRCQQGKTVFFSTHVLEVAERVCDRVAILKEGRIVAVGPISQLRGGTGGEVNDQASLEELFMELTGS